MNWHIIIKYNIIKYIILAFFNKLQALLKRNDGINVNK